MAKVERLDSLVRKLDKAHEKYIFRGNRVEVRVGYTAEYALYVHEDSKARHKGKRQYKFLEQPAREKQTELMAVVTDQLAKGATFEKALRAAGLRLQRESQKIVPIDTGNLRGSAFTRRVKS